MPTLPATRRRSRRTSALCLGLAAAAISGGCHSEPGPLGVLLISIDTLRPDHLGIYGYEPDTSPKTERFIVEGAVCDRAYATGSRTPPSGSSSNVVTSPLTRSSRQSFPPGP